MKVSVPEGSFNYSLQQWLAGTTDTKVPKRCVFDNLNFETGSTKLTPESVPTVDSLVTILKAYPAVSLAWKAIRITPETQPQTRNSPSTGPSL